MAMRTRHRLGIVLSTVLLIGAVVAHQRVGAQPQGATNLIDYTTDGADIERSGWIKDEKILTRQNVGTLKLQWKLETGNQPRALHALMPVLVIGQLSTPGGVEAGRHRQRHLGQPVRVRRRDRKDPLAEALGLSGAGGPRRRRRRRRRIRQRLGFLQPGGSSDTPVIGPPDAQGRRPVYFVTGDGMLHILNAADGEPICSRRTCSTPARAGR